MAKAKKKPAKKVSIKKAPAKKTAKVKKAVKKVAKKTIKKKAPTKKPAKKVTKAQPIQKIVLAKPQAQPKSKKIDLSQFMTPLDDRLVVQTNGTEKMTAGGLYIPATVADTSGNLQGTVIAVGRGRRNKKGYVRPMDVQVGDKVLFAEYAGSKIKYQSEELIILREEDVMGIVD